jgi:predicted permease
MSNSLLQAYLPLLVWPGLGLLLFKILPDEFPRFLGRGLYWVGIPLEIFALAHQTDFSDNTGLAPLFTVIALVIGLALALASLRLVRWASLRHTPAEGLAVADVSAAPSSPAPPSSELPTIDWTKPSRQGSFVLSSMIGNTGFVGLAVVPAFVSTSYVGWVVFYSVTQNVVGTYGLGVFIASWFGRRLYAQSRWQQLQDVITVPSLWAFCLGYLSHRWVFPDLAETGLHYAVWTVIPVALLLMGMRLSQLKGWESLRLAVVPALLKVLILPAVVGGIAIAVGLPGEACLVLVLMSGMPSAFAGLILAEEYELDRELIASSIALSTIALLVTLPLWLTIFAWLPTWGGMQ